MRSHGLEDAPSRLGDWMITYTGRRFWPLDPHASEVSFRDIGHALSLICRYGGHTRRFYSVAEHSCRLARYFVDRGETELARYALLHDATEAYIGDMIRPLKRSMANFVAIERVLEDVIFEAAGLRALPDEVRQADTAIVNNEARDLFRTETRVAASWVLGVGLPGVVAVGVPSHQAENDFATLFLRLFPERSYD